MVYSLGHEETLGHTSRKDPLDGDFQKIEIADKIPDAGYDMHTASTYPSRQGRPVLTEHVPTRVRWKERAKVPDVKIVRGFFTVSPRFREIVEQFEPDVHQFLPVDYVDSKGDVLAKRYFFIACNRLDSVDREHSKMVLYKGKRWRAARDLIRRGDEIPPGFDVDAEPKVVFSNAQIGNKHAWSDMFLVYGPYLSRALGDALKAEKLTGALLIEHEAV